jgi:hypothetical protein
MGAEVEMSEEDKTPQQLAADIIAAHFQNDAAASAAAEQIAAMLDEAELLIDPLENALYQNLREGKMKVTYREGAGLRWQITAKGERHVENLGGDQS